MVTVLEINRTLLEHMNCEHRGLIGEDGREERGAPGGEEEEEGQQEAEQDVGGRGGREQQQQREVLLCQLQDLPQPRLQKDQRCGGRGGAGGAVCRHWGGNEYLASTLSEY